MRALPRAAVASLLLVAAAPAAAQGGELRSGHEDAVRSLVRLQLPEAHASGWVTELLGLPLIVTAKHAVARYEGEPIEVHYYGGRSGRARVAYLSDSVDVAVLAPQGEVPVPSLRFTRRDVVRGERVVLGGNPGPLRFITSEGVIAGAVSGAERVEEACGDGRNCVVIDAEGEGGSSGGPVVDRDGRVIGMIWGVYPGTSFTVAVHAQTLFDELLSVQRRIRRAVKRRMARGGAPPASVSRE